MRYGKHARSPALVADGKHLMTDVVSSVGVLGGVVLVMLTGWKVMDPALAVLVGLTVLWSGWGLVKESVGGLMDEAASHDTLDKIRVLISEHGEGALEAQTCALALPANPPSSIFTWWCRAKCPSTRHMRSATGSRLPLSKMSPEPGSPFTSNRNTRPSIPALWCYRRWPEPSGLKNSRDNRA